MQPKLKVKPEDVRQALLSAGKNDPLVTFHMSVKGKAILEQAAQDEGNAVSQYIRKALVDAVAKTYKLGE